MYRETHKEEIKEKRKIRYEKSKELKKNKHSQLYKLIGIIYIL